MIINRLAKHKYFFAHFCVSYRFCALLCFINTNNMTPTLIILLILAFTFAAGVLIGEYKKNDDLILWSSGLLVIVVLAAIVLFIIDYV